MMHKIAVFNHKGGVSKTTTVYHLGWMLTNKGKRVLLVDTDSQCNLTLTVIGDDNYEKFNEENPKTNIKSALAPAFDSRPELIQPIDAIPVKGNSRLFLIPGSFEITEYEVQLGVSFQLSHSFSTMKNLPGAFNYLIEKTALKYNIEYILLDLNPSLSAINQDLVLVSDYFIVPTSPDYFSKMALKSIARILPQWEKWAKSARQLFADATYTLPNNTPKFLGYTVNDYTLKSGEPSKAFQIVIDDLNQVINRDVVPNLEKVGMTIEKVLYKGNDYCLAKIPNFHSLQPRFQQYGVPIYELTDAQIGSTGPVLEQQSANRKKFKTIYSDFADKIIMLTQNAN
jgi:chromosome partitioning protein